ncbi:hypothetical protein H7F33_05595 [Pedobacter sp. PAMC26386]|nr:hypothetical protein H7F33_05595 [Pedobacter sp. PAMC26386]
MNRNEITVAGSLQTGDRFYKRNDKGKVVFEKVEGEIKKTEYQTYTVNARKNGAKFTQSMKGNTEVVFLRHAYN